MIKKVGAYLLLAVAIVVGVQQVTNEPTKTALEVEVTGTDRVLLVAVVYEPAEGRAVEEISAGAKVLAKSCGTVRQADQIAAELWRVAAPELGTVPVTITMTEDCDAQACVIALTDTAQDTPYAGTDLMVGDAVDDCKLRSMGGEATLLLIFHEPTSRILQLPTGFDLISSQKAGDYTLTMADDDDASTKTADLVFDGQVNFAAFTIGVNRAP